MRHHNRARTVRNTLVGARVLAWLPIVIALVAACGGGNGTSY